MSDRSTRRSFYETIAERFEELDNRHDIERRLAVVFDELIPPGELTGRLVLDAGCGYGAFASRAARCGARVVSLDIAGRLVRISVDRTRGAGVVADASMLPFRTGIFDAVISSEMIEHTESPSGVVCELARALRPGGLLVVTTPNRVWQAAVRLASHLRIRPFHGLENFLRWSDLESIVRAQSLQVVRHVGLHAWPFQLGLSRLSTAVDRRFGAGPWARLMINQALAARKMD